MDPQLHSLVFERVADDPALAPWAAELVLAACDGPEALAALLAGEARDDGDRPAPEPAPPPAPVEPPGAFLSRIWVEGFRGVGPGVELELAPGPGLTLVIGRNGSGKSSFAEALELLMTGANRRWEKRTKVWREGWQNLHHDGPTTLEAELHVDGHPGAVRLRRTWERGAPVDDGGATTVANAPRGAEDLDALGWAAAVQRYRPFLSYSELGAMFDELKTMYDALAAILGLEDIDEVVALLREARLERERAFKAFRTARDAILPRLDAIDDDRARAAATALRDDDPDLDAVELALEGAVEGADPEAQLNVLRALCALEAPSPARAGAAFDALAEAEGRVAALAGTDAARADALADLLDAALRHREGHVDDTCPVCRTPGKLTEDWRDRAEREARALRDAARDFRAARDELAAARRAVAALIAGIDGERIAHAAELVGLDGTAVRERAAAWDRAAAAPQKAPPPAGRRGKRSRKAGEEPRAALAALSEALDELAADARAELDRRDEAWRPLAAELRAMLPEARAALAARADVPALKAAEAWMRDAADELRADRLAPIAERARANWERLRHESNVSFDGLRLRRSGAGRAAEIDVSVDGSGAPALGVMSQGELHALAVSVFLPRAGFVESPFRFAVIDDPVQSMDPAKVDGLATVLAEAAADRQVVVFTHDERLPEAVRRLGLPATVLEVTRRPGSVVEVREALDPVERYIADARALALTEEVPDEIARRVVPGFCRGALEAAAIRAVRRRRLARGERHLDVEEALARATTLLARLALALFDDPKRAGDVLRTVNGRYGRRAADAVTGANRGVHELFAGDLRGFIGETARLARSIAELE